MTPLPLGILALAGAGGAGAYDLLETTNISGYTTSVTFDNLDVYSDYKHLQLRVSADNGNNSWQFLTFNGDSGSSNTYTNQRLIGNDVQVESTTNVLPAYGILTHYGRQEWNAFILDVYDFANTNKYTTSRAIGGTAKSGSTEMMMVSGLWNNTNAVTSLTITGVTLQYTRYSLYGVKG